MKLKQIFFTLTFSLSFIIFNAAKLHAQANSNCVSEGKPIHLTKDMFIEKIMDYNKNKTWVYKGNKPCVIDLYATWCGPCKQIAPYMEDIAKKYAGKIDVYKIDTDEERELAKVFGVRSIPMVVYCPMKGDPQVTLGAMPKEQYEKIINEILLK